MSVILDFYRGENVHPSGFDFDEALSLPDSIWEQCHDYVQWFFPLPEPSRMHPNAPVATFEDFEVIRGDQELLENLKAAVGRYLDFLAKSDRWLRKQDHNHLRITRVIRCLVLAGLPLTAEFFYDAVLGMSDQYVSLQSLGYWMEALKEQPAWLKPAPSGVVDPKGGF